jgi:hypothetical protein
VCVSVQCVSNLLPTTSRRRRKKKQTNTHTFRRLASFSCKFSPSFLFDVSQKKKKERKIYSPFLLLLPILTRTPWSSCTHNIPAVAAAVIASTYTILCVLRMCVCVSYTWWWLLVRLEKGKKKIQNEVPNGVWACGNKSTILFSFFLSFDKLPCCTLAEREIIIRGFSFLFYKYFI